MGDRYSFISPDILISGKTFGEKKFSNQIEFETEYKSYKNSLLTEKLRFNLGSEYQIRVDDFKQPLVMKFRLCHKPWNEIKHHEQFICQKDNFNNLKSLEEGECSNEI